VEGEFNEKEERYPSSKTIDAVKIYSLYGYVEMLGNTDKAITLGSSN
jgi:hypothetical protein